jgi:ketosteroid isomerase-like protein
MSQENVELAERAMAAFNRRDLDIYDDLFTQDFEWLPALPHTGGGAGGVGQAARPTAGPRSVLRI